MTKSARLKSMFVFARLQLARTDLNSKCFLLHRNQFSFVFEFALKWNAQTVKRNLEWENFSLVMRLHHKFNDLFHILVKIVQWCEWSMIVSKNLTVLCFNCWMYLNAILHLRCMSLKSHYNNSIMIFSKNFLYRKVDNIAINLITSGIT